MQQAIPILTIAEVEELMKMLTQKIVDETPHRGMKYAIVHSKTAQKLFSQGQKIIPEIGRYIATLPDNSYDASHKENVENGWRKFLIRIVENDKKVREGIKALVINFNDWATWARNYKPYCEDN